MRTPKSPNTLVICSFYCIILLYLSCLNMMTGNIEQRTIGYGCHQNQEAKLKIVEGIIPWPNQQKLIQPAAILYLSGLNMMVGNIEQRTIGYGCRQNQTKKPN